MTDYMKPCVHCSKPVDTREESKGGDKYGVQMSDGSWVCSKGCWDARAHVMHHGGAPEPVTVQVEPHQIVAAIRAMEICADDLEAELRTRHPEETRKQYPSEQRRFERDMEAVGRVMIAAAALRQTPGMENYLRENGS